MQTQSQQHTRNNLNNKRYMKNYIFDREKDKFLMNDDGENIHFESNEGVYVFLKEQQYTNDFIRQNFFIMKACKILIPEP